MVGLRVVVVDERVEVFAEGEGRVECARTVSPPSELKRRSFICRAPFRWASGRTPSGLSWSGLRDGGQV